MKTWQICVWALCLGPSVQAADDLAPWTDVTEASGLGLLSASRVKFADLDGNLRPDLVILPDGADAEVPLVFLSQDDPPEGRFVRLEASGLPLMRKSDILVFADLDNDGRTDAVLGRNLDIYQDDYKPPSLPPYRTAWCRGRGDGTFLEPREIPAARMATTCAIAVGDVNEDGLPDLWIGNWYLKYFSGYDAFGNDLLLQYKDPDGEPGFARWPVPDETAPVDAVRDSGGRPTYGTAIARLDDGLPMLLEMNYGRRWNRLYRMDRYTTQAPPDEGGPGPMPDLRDRRARPEDMVRRLAGSDIAPQVHVDGDAIRHGRHPQWPEGLAGQHPRSMRPDEPPFRANGNTFDVAVGDIDNDGDFDLFLSTIIHAWAGDSSDRSRFLVNQLAQTGRLDFEYREHLSVDRIPDPPPPGLEPTPEQVGYNQGDIYAELADLDNDGRLDLVLCSSDYPDPPPHDERLRIYLQQEDGRFADCTADLGIDHVGAGMPSLADFDLDGDLDLLIGQSFNRLTAEQRRAAALASSALSPGDSESAPSRPRVRLFRNESPVRNQSLRLRIHGNPLLGACSSAYGVIVRVTADTDQDPTTPDTVQLRQVLGPSGHAGKQHEPVLHFGLGLAGEATFVEIVWPGQPSRTTRLESVPAGYHEVKQPDPQP